ncbi:phage tail tape measure protein [Virgibacillus salexigens]|uniref:phage tail tape measure protein n=1 Tax=Virgibacillus salexigens TaxID=61016 RepID=UPI003081E21F
MQISEQKLENAINQSRNEIAKQSQEMQEAASDTDKYKKSLQEVAGEASDLGDKLNTGVTLPLAGVGAVAGKSAMDISDAVRLMTGSLGATGDEAKQLEDDMRTVWSEGFGDNPEEVARSIMMVKQNIQGIDEGEELQKATKNILLLANATESDLGEATRGVNQLMHNFGLTADEAMDLFKKGQEEGINYSNEMFDNIAEYAPLFNQMGFEADEYFSILANGAQNGAYNLDYVNDIMKEFNVRVQDGSDKTADAFENMSEETQNLFEEFKNGEATTEELFKAVIPELENMDDQVKANQIGVELFGTKFEDMGTDTVYALDDVNESMKNVEGSMDDFAKSQEQAFSRELKETIRGVTEALEPLGRELLEIAQEITPKIQELSDWFVNLDDDTQKFLLTMAGSAAFLGPALKAFSGLSGVIGGITTKFGNADKSAGAKGFGGTLLALVSRAGPVGIGIGALTGLGIAIASVSNKEEELNEVSLETYDSLMKQHESTGAMIDQMEKLRGKSELTSDEFARYVDLQAELETANSSESIKAIKDEMADLQGKSGLSNQELGKMVELNGNLVENLPGATEKITTQGEGIAGTTEEMKKYNEETLKMATLELEGEFLDAAENHNKLLEQRKVIKGDLALAQEKEKFVEDILNNYSKQRVSDARDKLITQQAEIEKKIRNNELSREEAVEAEKIMGLNTDILIALEGGKNKLIDQLGTMQQKTNEEQKSLIKKDQEIGKLESIYQKLQLQYLTNAGINEETARRAVKEGETLETLDRQIGMLQFSKDIIKQQTPPNERNTEEYKNQIAAIDEQIAEMQNAKGELSDLGGDARRYTDELGRDVSKNVNVNTNPSASSLNSQLSAEVWKRVNLDVPRSPIMQMLRPSYAKGTDFHPGGPALVGEEGPELIREGNKWSLAGFGVMPDLKRGADVFTYEQTKKILNGINQFPQYAGGVGVSSSMARRLDDMGTALANNRQAISNNFTIDVGVGDVIMDGRTVGSVVWRPVKENMDRDANILQDFRG